MIEIIRRKLVIAAVLAISLSNGSNILSYELGQEASRVSGYTESTHSDSKFSATINNRGWIGPSYRSVNFDWKSYGFEFPVHSKIDYLEVGGIWVGGVVGKDTLVSVTAFKEYLSPPIAPLAYAEFFPVPLNSGNLIDTLSTEDITIYSTRYSDTTTGDSSGLYLDSRTQRLHQPMGLEIHQRSYSTSVAPYRNILILDYTITNIGSQNIDSAFVGFMLDGGAAPAAVNSLIETENYIGSFKTDSTIYLIDNDGIVNSPTPELVRDALGLKCIRSSPPADIMNFNWWHSFPDPDFGPRLIPTEQDPYFYFGNGRNGMPNGDAVKYYMLSHPEWDYSQIFVKESNLEDSSWSLPERFASDSSVLGRDVTGLLSAGPFDLSPGTSIRIMYALFGGDLVHITEDNYQHIQDGQYQRFYDNLQMGILAENSLHSSDMGRVIVTPESPPTGLKLDYCSGSSAEISWDPWLFSDISGYTIHIRQVNQEELIAPRFVIPADNQDMSDALKINVSPDRTSYTIDNLKQGKLYFISISHITNGTNGNLTNPIVAGDKLDQILNNPVNTKRQFLEYQPGGRTLRISWEKSAGNVKYYKIYKTDDSIIAQNRHQSVLTDNYKQEYYELKSCWNYDQRSFCFYEMTGYDSVSSTQLEYIDRNHSGQAWYWVSAVYHEGFESGFSPLIKSTPAITPEKELLVIVGTTNSLYDYLLYDSLLSFYGQILNHAEYDLYNWSDSTSKYSECETKSCLNWVDFGNYKTIIINEYPSGLILRPDATAQEELISRLVDGGRTVIYFGLPSTQQQVNLSYDTEYLNYPDSSFECRYFGLKEAHIRSWEESYSTLGAIDSLGGFQNAIPIKTDWPQLDYDSENNRTSVFFNHLFITDQSLPYVSVFNYMENIVPLYQYGSAYESTSELQGMTCGLVNHKESGDLYLFSFPLISIKPEQASDLINAIREQSPYTPAEHNPTQIPNEFILSQNFPNPFNISTTIQFDLLKASTVNLQIFNGLGQEVKSLLSQELLTVGSHQLNWDGANNQGSDVASGVYLYRLRVNNVEASRKMVLLK